MQVVWDILCVFAGALFNSIFRGGALEALFKGARNIPATRYVNVLGFAIVAGLQSSSWQIALGALGGMLLGQAPGWQPYIAAIRGQGATDRQTTWWGVQGLAFRGLFWGQCLTAGMACASWWHYLGNMWPLAACWSLAGLLQGPIYWATVAIFRRLGWKGTPLFNDWTVAEMIHGAVLWAPLGLL